MNIVPGLICTIAAALSQNPQALPIEKPLDEVITIGTERVYEDTLSTNDAAQNQTTFSDDNKRANPPVKVPYTSQSTNRQTGSTDTRNRPFINGEATDASGAAQRNSRDNVTRLPGTGLQNGARTQNGVMTQNGTTRNGDMTQNDMNRNGSMTQNDMNCNGSMTQNDMNRNGDMTQNDMNRNGNMTQNGMNRNGDMTQNDMNRNGNMTQNGMNHRNNSMNPNGTINQNNVTNRRSSNRNDTMNRRSYDQNGSFNQTDRFNQSGFDNSSAGQARTLAGQNQIGTFNTQTVADSRYTELKIRLDEQYAYMFELKAELDAMQSAQTAKWEEYHCLRQCYERQLKQVIADWVLNQSLFA